jgi:hypothetical protein
MQFCADSLPFSHRTANRYIAVYENRDKLKLDNAVQLREAYALIWPDAQEKPSVASDSLGKPKRGDDPLVETAAAKGIPRDVTRKHLAEQKAAAAATDEPEPVANGHPEPEPKPRKGWEPEPLTMSDLTLRERAAIKRLLDLQPMRRKAIRRAICEAGLLGEDA